MTPQRISWEKAKRICEEGYQAKLVEIDSDEENTAVNNELKQRGHRFAWLGQGAHCVHYSLIFIVYTILLTICTLLKLYTIGYIAGSGGKNKGYRFKMSQLSSITRMEDDW